MKKIIITSILYALFVFPALAQQVTVKNKSDNRPVQGVIIYNSSKSVSVQTDEKGRTNISAFPVTDSLFVRFIGFETLVFTRAQLEAAGWQVALSETSFDLDEVVYSANKVAEKRNDLPQQIEVIKAGQIEHNNPQTSADMLAQTGKVFMQMSQQGGGSPVIRGFESNRVLMIVDGVRMNNAIYRGGHLQNVITIDPNALDRVEVLYGPGSVMYGSDALGGVMHFYTRKPMFATGDKLLVNGAAFTRYASANEEKSGNVTLNIGGKRIASLTSITYKDFGDLRAGANRNPSYPTFGLRPFYAQRFGNTDSMVANADTNVQKNSGYTQTDLLQKIRFRLNKYTDITLNVQYSNSSDIPRYDRLTEMSGGKLKYGEWYYGPQTRLLTSLRAELSKSNRAYNNAAITFAMQDIDESRIDRRFNKVQKRYQIENVKVNSLNADFMKELKGHHEIRYGAEILMNKVTSKAHITTIDTDSTYATKTRYPDGDNTQNTLAAYVTHSWEISPKLFLSDGLRFSSVSLKSSFVDTLVFPYPFKDVNQKNSAFNGHLGLVYMPGRQWRLNVNGSTGFRAGNLDDVSKFFDSSPGGFLIVPNDKLKPEYVTSGEVGISKVIDKKVSMELNAWYSSFTNIIIMAPFQLNGQDSFLYSGVMTQTQANQNKRSAYITGFTASVMADISSSVSVSSTLTYTYGRLHDETPAGKDTLVPLDHIPPVHGLTSVILKKKKFRGEFYMRYAGWKLLKDYRLGAEDNELYATPQGMPGWVTFNIRAEYAIHKNLKLQAGVENILDYHYRYFASGISAPGRNVVLALRANF